MKDIRDDLRACTICADRFAATATGHRPNPVVWFAPGARILIASQAPGLRVHEANTPFWDASGKRLRDWLGVDEATFYDRGKVAIIPMGFCFPGYDKNGGDIPPMKRCAETWRQPLLDRLPNIELTVLIGGYAQKWHIGDQMEKTLTATVRKWQNFLDQGVMVTPHPSWRNNAWLKRNPWFETELLPELRKRVRSLLC